MEAMRESWPDDRLDDFAARVDRRFEEVDRRFDEVDRRLDAFDARLSRIEAGVWGLQRTIALGFVAITGGIIAGFAAMIGLVATQL
jgi:hypothetical protein